MKVQEALESAIEYIESTDYEKRAIDVLKLCKSALSDIEKCEPVALVALNNAALQKRIEVLEDLLTSAAAIASRNGEGTHWKRFIGQLKVNGIGNITAKTFRILPSDEGYTSPISKEWVGLSDKDINEGVKSNWVEKQAFESAAWWAEDKLKQLNTKG